MLLGVIFATYLRLPGSFRDLPTFLSLSVPVCYFFGFVLLYGLYLGCDTRAMVRVVFVSGSLCSLCFYGFALYVV